MSVIPKSGNEVVKITYVDLILPLAMPKLLTYQLSHLQKVQVGQRVLVHVGKKKEYAAIVNKIHNNKPDYTTKEVIDVLAEAPIVHLKQLELWAWMSRYYMTSMGEIMIAGLPSSLKLQSESVYMPSGKLYNDRELSTLKPQEQAIVDALEHNQQMSLKEISELLKIKFPHSYIQNLLNNGWLMVYESHTEKYRPKTVQKINLSPKYLKNETLLETVFKELLRAPKQEALLLKFLQLKQDLGDKAILKKKLLKAADTSPSVLNSLIDRGVLVSEDNQVGRIIDNNASKIKMPILSNHQKKAEKEVSSLFAKDQKVLLHGVTGSGKTEIYIHLIEKQLKKNKKVLYLLPEIAITTQIIQRLQSYFGKKVGVYHSRFNISERTELWYAMMDEKLHEYDIILGARSSVFLPFKNLGLIIVDEEHESSYKQFDPSPRYHARDVASKLSQMYQANLLLGSATPSMEMMHLVKEKKNRICCLR